MRVRPALTRCMEYLSTYIDSHLSVNIYILLVLYNTFYVLSITSKRFWNKHAKLVNIDSEGGECGNGEFKSIT